MIKKGIKLLADVILSFYITSLMFKGIFGFRIHPVILLVVAIVIPRLYWGLYLKSEGLTNQEYASKYNSSKYWN